MFKLRSIAVLMAVTAVTACAKTPMKISTTTRFEANPLAFSQNPTITQQMSQTYITNEAELTSAAKRIDAEALDVVDEEAEMSTSARSSISLL